MQVAARPGLWVVYSLFGLLWSAAVILTTDTYMRGEQPPSGRVYGRTRYAAIRRAVLLVRWLFVLSLVAASLLSTVLFVVIGIRHLLGQPCCALSAWCSGGCGLARKTWVKWLIVLTAPFGLPTYTADRWALYLAAVVLEDNGPIGLPAPQQRAHRHATGFAWPRL